MAAARPSAARAGPDGPGDYCGPGRSAGGLRAFDLSLASRHRRGRYVRPVRRLFQRCITLRTASPPYAAGAGAGRRIRSYDAQARAFADAVLSGSEPQAMSAAEAERDQIDV